MGAPVFVFMAERPSAGGALRAKEINWLLARICSVAHTFLVWKISRIWYKAIFRQPHGYQ